MMVPLLWKPMRLGRLVAIAAVVIAGCGSSANSARPLIDDIPVAISALESSIGSDLNSEVSADLTGSLSSLRK